MASHPSDAVVLPGRMARTESQQLNIRSRFARERAAVLAHETGMTTTQVVEEALRAYVPPPHRPESLPPGLIRKGPLLVMRGDGRRITLEEANAALEAVRTERE